VQRLSLLSGGVDVKQLSEIQTELRPWVKHNFGVRPAWQPLLGLQEELGELSHAFLKREQGIRTSEDYVLEIRDSAADLVIFLLDFCNAEGIDLAHEVAFAWEHVQGRDWKKFPENGTDA